MNEICSDSVVMAHRFLFYFMCARDIHVAAAVHMENIARLARKAMKKHFKVFNSLELPKDVRRLLLRPVPDPWVNTPSPVEGTFVNSPSISHMESNGFPPVVPSSLSVTGLTNSNVLPVVHTGFSSSMNNNTYSINPAGITNMSLTLNNFSSFSKQHTKYERSKINYSREFQRTPEFLQKLSMIGWDLRLIREKPIRNAMLKEHMSLLNKSLPSLAYLPVTNRSSDEQSDSNSSFDAVDESFRNHAILRIPEEEAFCLHSNQWAPYHLCVEVLDFERSKPLQKLKRISAAENNSNFNNNNIATNSNWAADDDSDDDNNVNRKGALRSSKSRKSNSKDETSQVDLDANHLKLDAASCTSLSNDNDSSSSDEAEELAYYIPVNVNASVTNFNGGGSNVGSLNNVPAGNNVQLNGTSVVGVVADINKNVIGSCNAPDWIATRQSQHPHPHDNENSTIDSREHHQQVHEDVASVLASAQAIPPVSPTVHCPPPLSPFTVDAANSVANSTANIFSLTLQTAEDDEEEEDDEDAVTRMLQSKSSANGGGPKGIFGNNTWDDIKNKVRKSSPFGHLPGWRLVSVIVKTCPDLKQEQLAADLLTWFQRVFQSEKKTKMLWVQPFHVLAIGNECGLVETIANAVAIDNIKQSGFATLEAFFQAKFKQPESLIRAKFNYVNSMAAYSIISYILALRDRHNANILVDTEGHVLHVDFGFMFTNAPGGVQFEPTLFKLTEELMEVMGGENSEYFSRFKKRVHDGFRIVRKRAPEILNLVRFIMMGQENLSMPCFKGSSPDRILSELEIRLGINLSDSEHTKFVDQVISDSIKNWRSTLYDRYQRLVTGIH